MAEPLDRFRSFAERYVIERASLFAPGREQEQAWMAIQDAKKIYGMIAEAKNETDPAPLMNPARNVPSAQLPGATGPIPPKPPMPWLQAFREGLRKHGTT